MEQVSPKPWSWTLFLEIISTSGSSEESREIELMPVHPRDFASTGCPARKVSCTRTSCLESLLCVLMTDLDWRRICALAFISFVNCTSRIRWVWIDFRLASCCIPVSLPLHNAYYFIGFFLPWDRSSVGTFCPLWITWIISDSEGWMKHNHSQLLNSKSISTCTVGTKLNRRWWENVSSLILVLLSQNQILKRILHD